MLTSILEIARRLRRDERGNVFILFGACAIPLLLLMGGVIDMARYSRYKIELANALDSAALALGRVGEDYTEEEAKEFVQDYIASFALTDSYFTLDEDDYVVTKTDQGFQVTAVGSVETIFLPLGQMTRPGIGIRSLDLNIAAEVVHNSNRLELALVLDNTGSMNCAGTVGSCATNWSAPASDSRIVALKDAAKTLVDTLMKDDMDDPDQIKIGLVPFEGMVNVASTGFDVTNPPSWIDWNAAAAAKYNGRNLNNAVSCTNFGSGSTRIGHRCLFDKLTANDSRVKWAGCVEMRAGTYELSDAAPDASIPDSLFVPFFAPDEPDSANDGGYTYPNNYLVDQVSTSEVPSPAQKSLAKYNSISWRSGRKDYDASTSPYEYGPNRGCPKPIVPLTNGDGKAAIKTAIDNMIAYWATGTYIPVGLMWGWHVLSPGIPYTEGLAPGDDYYDETVKAIVLLTDGDNQVQPGDQGHNKSNYSGYNYVSLTVDGQYRLASTAPAAEDALDTKTASLCTSVKAAGIRLYTITFGTLAAATQTMMENCATLDEGERLYYHAPTSSDLDEIFVQIGEDLTRVHLSM